MTELELELEGDELEADLTLGEEGAGPRGERRAPRRRS